MVTSLNYANMQPLVVLDSAAQKKYSAKGKEHKDEKKA